jgi:cell wall-associated NlpC family hydrolase
MDTEVKIGDIFITRNAGGPESDEKGGANMSPGYFNHAAIYVGDGIVEAQADPIDKVILSDYDEFWYRYPIIKVLRLDESVGKLAAERAKSLVGSSYRTIASIFKHLRKTTRGENCVSVVRKAYRDALGSDPRWKIPDSIAGDNNLKLILEKDETK